MYDNARIHFIAVALLSLAAFITTPAEAKFLGAKRVFCTTCCSRATQDGTNLVGECTDTCNGNICLSNTLGEFTDTYPLINALDAEGTGLNLSLHFNGENANGEKASLDTGIGFGWSHSYNTLLFTQDRDVFKMSPGGTVTKYQRSGRTGPLKAITGTQQDIVQNADGSIEITNRQGGMKFRFEKIPANPVRVAGMAPWMLKSITDRNNKKTELTYQNGLLHRVTDAFGRQIKFEYDASKHLRKITDPLGRVTQLNYGGYNDLTKITDPLGNAVHYQYDVRHQIIKKTEKNGNQWRFKYDSAGHPIEVLDTSGQSVLKLSNPVNWATNSSDLTVQKLRTYIPSVTTLTDGRGNQWQYFYNADGQITKKVAPDNATTTYTYEPATLNMASMTDANGHTTLYEYDGFGNLAKQIDANGNEVRYEYDNPFNYVSQVAYFASGALTSHSVSSYEYDAFGNRIKQTRDVGGLELQTDWTYYVSGAPEPGNPSGLRGLVKTEELHNGAILQITRYEYDAFGNRTKVTNPEGHVTLYEYDILGNRIKMTDGNGHEWVYAYDALDRLTQEIDPLGYATRYAYDGNGNRIRAQKQVTQSQDNFQTTEYQYDYRNRLIKETRDPGGLNLETVYVYDNNDNRIKVIDPRGKATDFAYDEQNRLRKVTDALGNQTQYGYDAAGNRIQETDANGNKSCSQYDALNRLTVQIRKMGDTSCALTAANDIVTRHFYDSGAVMACDHDPGSPSCNGPTPGSNNIAHTIDPEGKHSYFKYDKVDRRWITIRKVADSADACDGDDWCEFNKYDDASNVIARIDANGNRTNYSYFANNWLHTETTDPGGLNLTTTTIYDGVGNTTGITNPRGNVITNTFDDRNQLVLITDSIGKIADFQYDGIGNRTQKCDGNTNCTGYSYDAVNRLVAVTDAMANITSNGYDKAGNLIKITDRESHVSCHYYDDINRRTRTAQLMGGSNCAVLSFKDLWTATEYDAVGNVTSLITARLNSTPEACKEAGPPEDCQTTSYQYDPADRLVLETYADGTTRHFSYDKAGNLVQRADQLGQITQYRYNDLYYLMLRDYLDPAEFNDTFDYDVGGRMLYAERNGWITNFDDYDAANRLLQTTQDASGSPMVVQYAYDTTAGKRDITYPGGRVCNEQNDLRERLVGSNCDNFSAAYGYDLGNRVESRTYNNGVTADYSYNANNWIISLNHSGDVANLNYDYDKEGNKKYEDKQHDPAKSESYAYDDVYRLIDYKVGELVGSTVQIPTTQHEYDLDKVGNWDQFSINGVVFNNTPNQMNEYDDPSTDGLGAIPDDLGIPNNFKDPVATLEPDGENWAHDKNGNRREDGKRIYVYDDENRLIQVTRKSDNLVSEYQYDALSRRVVKTVGVGSVTPVTTRYAYDDARIVEEQNGTAVTQATYVYGNYIDEVLNMQRGGADYYYHQNALWSVVAVTNAAGVVVERYDYTDYGCPSLTHSAIGNPWMFTGRQWDDESGVYFYRARYYDCESGRFLHRDPLGYVDGMNLYEYVNSHPINEVDPFGQFTFAIRSEGSRKVKEDAGEQTRYIVEFDITDDRCCCTDVNIMQIVRYRPAIRLWRGYTEWDVDDGRVGGMSDKSRNKPFYNDVGGIINNKLFKTPSVVMSDRPDSVESRIWEFEVCALCVNGLNKGLVYGCINWAADTGLGEDSYWSRGGGPSPSYAWLQLAATNIKYKVFTQPVCPPPISVPQQRNGGSNGLVERVIYYVPGRGRVVDFVSIGPVRHAWQRQSDD